jgi:hypothetical protein
MGAVTAFFSETHRIFVCGKRHEVVSNERGPRLPDAPALVPGFSRNLFSLEDLTPQAQALFIYKTVV